MKKLASIECNDGKRRYRRNIYLYRGRIICDGDDITPMSGRYERGQAGRDRAAADIEAMYAGDAWRLEWAD